MGILEHVSGLEDMMSGMEEAEKPKQKQKKAEAARPDSLSNSRLEKIEGDMEALRETVRGIGREKGAAGENSLQDILRRLDETDKKIDETVADVGEKIETLKKAQTGENRGFFGLKPDSEKRIDEAIKKLDKNSEIIVKKQEEIIIGIEERIRNFEETAKSSGGKNSLELRSKMDALQKYVEGKMGAMDKMIDEKIGSSAADGRIKMLEKKQGEMKSLMQCGSSGINSGIDGRINDAVKKMDDTAAGIAKEQESVRKELNERLKDFAGKSDLEKSLMEMKNAFASKADIGRLNNAVDGRLAELSKNVEAEKKIDENLKLFALNSDVEKVWKETESLKRYVDEKTKMADGLANSLRVWESRNMQLMEKEHDFDEKMGAFPELKLLEGRIRRMERALVELQKRFVAAQITEPIIME